MRRGILPPHHGTSPACAGPRGLLWWCERRGPEINVHHFIERRAFRRFRFIVPVLFRSADSAEHYDVGHSRNVGLGGMFTLASKCPPVGTQVEIDFAIPAFDRIPRQLRLCCKGQVTRVETWFEIAGFAMAGHIEEVGQPGDIEAMALAAGLLPRR